VPGEDSWQARAAKGWTEKEKKGKGPVREKAGVGSLKEQGI